MTAHEISTDDMLRELAIVFPALWKRRLSEFGASYLHMGGAWTGAASAHVMPDAEPPYANGPIHEGFEVWLSNRGWTWETYDGGTFWLLPLSVVAELEAAAA